MKRGLPFEEQERVCARENLENEKVKAKEEMTNTSLRAVFAAFNGGFCGGINNVITWAFFI